MPPQVQKCTAEANAAATQERSGKGGSVAVGGGSASALLLGVGRAATAGLVLALAGVKRECDRSALAAWTTGGVAQVRPCVYEGGASIRALCFTALTGMTRAVH